MPHGRVKRYQRTAGFGFIETEEGDLFVHHTALADREFLLEGQQVEFQVEAGDRGPRAVNVRVTGEVSLERKNNPDWRGHRGGTPRFEDQDRVLPARARQRRPRPVARAGTPATEHVGPPRDDGEDGDAVPENEGAAHER